MCDLSYSRLGQPGGVRARPLSVSVTQSNAHTHTHAHPHAHAHATTHSHAHTPLLSFGQRATWALGWPQCLTCLSLSADSVESQFVRDAARLRLRPSTRDLSNQHSARRTDCLPAFLVPVIGSTVRVAPAYAPAAASAASESNLLPRVLSL